MIQKTTRMTMRDIQEERVFGTNIIKCDKCGVIVRELTIRTREHVGKCAKCFSDIEDFQEQNVVTEEDLIMELNV